MPRSGCVVWQKCAAPSCSLEGQAASRDFCCISEAGHSFIRYASHPRRGGVQSIRSSHLFCWLVPRCCQLAYGASNGHLLAVTALISKDSAKTVGAAVRHTNNCQHQVPLDHLRDHARHWKVRATEATKARRHLRIQFLLHAEKHPLLTGATRRRSLRSSRHGAPCRVQPENSDITRVS